MNLHKGAGTELLQTLLSLIFAEALPNT